MCNSELREWVRRQKNISVKFRGEQWQLFESESVRVFEIYGDDGESKLATETALFEITLPLLREGGLDEAYSFGGY